LPTFTWTGVAGGTYEIWLADQTTGTYVTYDNLTSTSFVSPQPLILGHNYEWWAGTMTGQSISWGSPMTFTVRPVGSGAIG